MKPILDVSIFRQAAIDSGSLATRSSIIHRLAEQGEYRGTVYRGTAKVGTFSLIVCDCAEMPMADEALPRQAHIDLAALDSSSGTTATASPRSLMLRTGGHVIFSVTTGSGQYAVELVRREAKKEPVTVFDSRLLGKGDIFVTHVMRPGTYAIRNTRGKGYAVLTVAYPERGKLARNMEPVLVECRDGSMNPPAVKIQPVQALMFSCAQESRITIELEKGEDRPRPPRPPVIAPAAVQKKETPAPGGEKTIRRKIRFYG